MVVEVAQFQITAGTEDQFAAGYRAVRDIIAQSPGCLSMRMTRGIESPSQFVLFIEWESVALHEQFRASEGFPAWRAGIGPCFAGPPNVEHYADID